jgi:3-oxoacyl-[acyl-carrier protein] reductase
MDRSMVGARVLVTGGTSGIGLACAHAALTAGASAVVVVGRDSDRGVAAQAHLGPRATFLAADCADPDAVEDMVARTLDVIGGIDGLIASPGTTHLPELLHRQSLRAIA